MSGIGGEFWILSDFRQFLAELLWTLSFFPLVFMMTYLYENILSKLSLIMFYYSHKNTLVSEYR